MIRDIKSSVRWLSAIVWLLSAAYVQAQTETDDVVLQIKPARCIALHEGQVCYQTLNINWHASSVDNYCLYQQDNKSPVMCWDNLASGKGSYDFESNSTRKFFMVRKRDAKQLAEFSVEVAWVYDASTHRESHWRIF